MIVAIDGPAGAGKSTTAQMLAARFGWAYVDTGAMYRAVAWLAHQANLDPQRDPAAIARTAETAHIVLGVQSVTVGGQDVSAAIRTPAIAKAASQVAALPAVREAMVALQRRIGREGEARTGGAVLEGRDIQTVVFPDAEVKVFLTADLTTRATRRTQELARHDADTPDKSAAQGSAPSVESSLQALSERDSRDENRTVAPLQAAPDAVLISTDGLTPEEVVQRIAQLIEDLPTAASSSS